MVWPVKSGVAVTAAIYDIDDLRELLLAVLPAFVALAKDIEEGHDDATTALRTALDGSDPPQFYLQFYSGVFILDSTLQTTDPARSARSHASDEEKARKHLMLVLDELESRFLSRRLLPLRQATGFILGTSGDETYPKLRALRRHLLKDGASDQTALSHLRAVVRIASSKQAKRSGLLKCVNEAIAFFSGPMQAARDDDGQSCPARFDEYPSKHVGCFAASMYRLLQQGWSCSTSSGCHIASHVARKAQLSLTAYRCFETTPVRRRDSFANSAQFRILFPTDREAFEWQDSWIEVKDQGREDDRQEELRGDLCIVIRNVTRGSRLRMAVYNERLWQLRVDYDRPFFKQTEECRLEPLRHLLQPRAGGRESRFSAVEGKDRLILSFILATSVLHFHQGPWLQRNLSSENVCFLIRNARSTLDITQPYLTTNCSDAYATPDTTTLNNAHPYPAILSLGILLLEIASGYPMEFGEQEDQCFAALERHDALLKTWQGNGSKATPDGLLRALSACLDPSCLAKKGLDKATTRKGQVSSYVFEEIVYPLGEAMSVAYEIKLDKLHDEILQQKNTAREPETLDYYEEKDKEKQQSATKWFDYLDGVHEFIDRLIDNCENLPDREATKHITVAVLDTGFQPPEGIATQFVEAGRIRATESEMFLADAGGQSRPSDWQTDKDGHGTHVAQILLKVSLVLDVHVARVFERRRDLEDVGLAAQIHQSIARAISRATYEWGVDMIVMCFGFAKPIQVIRKAIEDASKAERPPLFFAAARNDGANENVAWPGRVSEVMGVGSTDGDGCPSSFNPPCDKHPVLYALGEAVPVTAADPSNPSRCTQKFLSGTSCATPVAAGLAANLLACARMATACVPAERRDEYADLPRELQRRDGLRAVLRDRMSRTHNCGVASLLPWHFLSRNRERDNLFLNELRETLDSQS